jgi:hypothetical protein
MKKMFVVLMIAGALAGCKKETVTTYDCTGVTPTYTATIKPILDANCASSGCHSASSSSQGYDLSSYAGSKSASSKSAFLGSIQHKSGYKAMPQGSGQLVDSDIKLISCWVQNGTPQ